MDLQAPLCKALGNGFTLALLPSCGSSLYPFVLVSCVGGGVGGGVYLCELWGVCTSVSCGVCVPL